MKISVCNLRSIGTPKSVNVDGKVVLSGVNGAGKSTIAKTPYFVLTGKGLSLKNGEEEGCGSIEFAGTTFSRYKRKNSSTIRVNGKTCSEVAMYEHLAKMGYDPYVLCSLFDTETVLDGETILKVIGASMSVDKVLSFTALTGDALDAVKKYYAAENISVVTLPSISKAHKKFYSMRTENNRVVKSLRVLVENDADAAQQVSVDVDALMLRSNNVEKRIEELVLSIFTDEQNEKKLAEARATIAENRNKICILREKACPFTNEDLEHIAEQIRERQAGLDEIEQELAKAQERQLGIIKDISNEKANWRIIVENGKAKAQTLDTLSTTTVCPLHAGVSCTTNMDEVKKQLSNEIVELREECKKIDAKIKSLEVELRELEAHIQLLTEKKQTLQKEVLNYTRKKTEMENERSAFAAIEGQIKAIEAVIEEAEKKANNISVENIEEKKKTLAFLRAELSDIKKAILDASKLSDVVKRYNENLKLLEEAEKTTAMYTFILQELNVLPNKIFEQIIAPIEKALNQLLSEIKNDWSIKFLFDGANIDICIVTPLGEINIDEVSTGERVVVNYVFKALICKMIKFDTIVLDNTDALDVKNYNMVEAVVEKTPYNTLLINCGDVVSKFPIVKF